MLNGVNNKEGILNSQLDKQTEVSSVVTNPLKSPYQNLDKSLLIDETAISNQAINLYQKEQDIKQFANLAMSDPEDMSHEEILANLFDKGVVDPFSDDVFGALSQNQKLWNDLAG